MIERRKIDEVVVADKPLGRHIEHDPASREYPFALTLAPSVLHDVMHHRYGSIFNQGQLGSCTGNAAAGAVNSAPLHVARRTLHEADALKLYELATVLDGLPGQYPPDDTGSSGLAAAKAAKQSGYISRYLHAFTVEEAVSALQKGPVITGIDWYEGFDRPSPEGHVSISGQIRGGHEVVARGYTVAPTLDDSLVWLDNSWGTSYGKAGHFCFTVGTWRQLLADQGDATILVH